VTETAGIQILVKRLINRLKITDATEISGKTRLIEQLRSRDQVLAAQAFDLIRVRGWLRDGSLCGAELESLYLPGAQLHEADLSRANLQRARLLHCNLSWAHLEGTDFRGANLTGSDLQNAYLVHANLLGAYLMEVDLRFANLSDATLKGARMGGTSLFGAVVDYKQLAQTVSLHNSIMPDGCRYDGRFNLPEDIRTAKFLDMDTSDPLAMADFYGVSGDAYVQGQSESRTRANSYRTVGEAFWK